jgi:hypothetical protein
MDGMMGGRNDKRGSIDRDLLGKIYLYFVIIKYLMSYIIGAVNHRMRASWDLWVRGE